MGLQDAADRLEEAARAVSEIDFSAEKEAVAGSIHTIASALNLVSTALENAANAFRETFSPEPTPLPADTDEVGEDDEAAE